VIQPRVYWRWITGKDEKNKWVYTIDSAEGEPVSFSCKDFLRSLQDDEGDASGGEPVSAAITFTAPKERYSNKKACLLEDAKRGDTRLAVDLKDVAAAEAMGIKPGAMVRLWIYTSQPFADAIERDGGGGTERDQMATVSSVMPRSEGGVMVEIEQPLQFDFPFNEGQVDTWNAEKRGYTRTGDRSSWLQARTAIQECGIENLVLEQMQRIWFRGVVFKNAMNCWLRNIRIERHGRDPFTWSGMMNECRDCEFIDPIWANNTGGGSGYIYGGSFSLIDNIYARNHRHAPDFTGGTASVFRNSRFFSSDLQWHLNWGRSHLVENCTVDALTGTGSYGWAAFAQRNIADIHGPGMGPRNVIYNCDLIGPKGGIFLGGKSEAPLILHNRIRAWSGPAIVLRYHIFNGIFLGNTLAVMDRFEPAVLFGDPDPAFSRLHKTADRPKPLTHPGLGSANPGNDFLFNTVYGGNGLLEDGPWQTGRNKSEWRRSYGNKVLPWNNDPPRPKPAMASVFEMQRAHPEGFAHLLRDKALYQPDLNNPPPNVMRDDGEPVAFVNFSDVRAQYANDPLHWSGDEPGKGWHTDKGEPFGERTNNGKTLRYGWVNGRPQPQQVAPWADTDFRYRTHANWPPPKDDPLLPFGQWAQNQDLTWQIELEPGKYYVFLAAGSPRGPERFTAKTEEPLPFKQVNDFLLNGVILKDPGQSDVRRDAFWAEVEVGADRLLVLKPAPSAITPRVAFIQIYRRR